VESAAAQKCGGERCHERGGLKMKIAVDLIGAPTTKHADPSEVGPRVEKGHGAAGTEGACGDIGGGEARGGGEAAHRRA
jgi:hypothetical protein